MGLDLLKSAALLDRILEKSVDPGLFARYFSLVFAINADDSEHARTLIDELYIVSEAPVRLTILPFSRAALGDDFDRFPQLAFAAFSGANPMAPPGDELFASHHRKLL